MVDHHWTATKVIGRLQAMRRQMIRAKEA